MERPLSETISKDLVTLSVEIPILLTDPWSLVGTDYKKSAEGLITLISKEILSAFNRVIELFYSLEEKLRITLGYVSSVADTKTRSELLQSQLKYLARSERVASDLIPKIVKEYFEDQGFRVEETSPEIDQAYKIDLICTKGSEVRLVQVKKGQVSEEEIREVFKKGSDLIASRFHQHEKRIVEIVASKFPDRYIETCNELSTSGALLKPTHLYQVYRKLPKYRYLDRG
jgi:hypothetical protein